jgi:hypothetical protein
MPSGGAPTGSAPKSAAAMPAAGRADEAEAVFPGI